MSPTSRPGSPRPPSIRPVILASFIGTTIEWYDFFLYGTAAALVFNRLFFPNVDPLAGTLRAYVTFAVGFLARPIGGAIFGHYGDRIGRKAMLVWSLMIMGVATALIGVLPTYATIGVWAPVCLVVIRFIQGIGVGGEWGGAVLMAVEHSGGARRGLHGSWPQMGAPAGSLLSTGVFALCSSVLDERTFLSWGWRLPFLLSTVLIGVGLVIRLRLLETPAFERVRQAGPPPRVPLVTLFKEHPREILVGTGMRLSQNMLFYVFTVFVLSYGQGTLHLSKNTMLAAVALISGISLITTPLYAALSDRIGRRPVYLAGALFSCLFAMPFFWLTGRGGAGMMVLALIFGMNVGQDLMYGPQAAFLSELFGAHVRYSGASLAYQLSSVFSGGLAPFIATSLLASYGPYAVGGYMAAVSAISVVATWLAPETHRRVL